MSQKIRLDQLLVQQGYFDSREKARRMIMAGQVYVNQQKEDKPGTKVSEDAEILLKDNPLPYVSRGGLKLEKAVRIFALDLADKVCLDIGASTGGFTDCMLQQGAKQVYAIDVGYGQLDWKLRQDPRVVSMERTNIRHVTPEMLGATGDFACIDVSFISLKLVLPVVKTLLHSEAQVVALVKPQFEAGRERVGKKGVVKDPKVHQEVVETIADFALSIGFHVLGCSFSPIKGPEGNIEFLLYLSLKQPEGEAYPLSKIAEVVAEAHGALTL